MTHRAPGLGFQIGEWIVELNASRTWVFDSPRDAATRTLPGGASDA